MKKNVSLMLMFCFAFGLVGYGTPCIPRSTWSEVVDPNCVNYGFDECDKRRTHYIIWDYAPYNAGTNPYTWSDTVNLNGNGRYFRVYGETTCKACYASFNTPQYADRIVTQTIVDQDVSIGEGGVLTCYPTFTGFPHKNPISPTCSCSPTGPPNCPPGQTASWNEVICEYSACNGGSPIIIDLDNDGYRLTSATNGVMFDLEARGYKRKWSWTAAGSDEAFLVLDRNHNGRVDDGKELFGDATDQSPVPEYNGFNALKPFDVNGDDWIDEDDSIYSQLRLWADRNHNGISEPSEFRTLSQEGVEGISLNYQVSRATDQYGNRFRFRALVRGRGIGRLAWDVFFVPSQ